MVPARLLVGDDGSTGAATARAWADSLAFGLGAEIITVRVVDRPEAVATRGEIDDERVGQTVPELLAAARDVSADLVIVGRRGSGGFGALALGSTAHQLAEHSDRPVAVVPPATTRPWPPTRIAVGHDGSRAAGGALEWGSELAGAAGAQVVVVHALDLGPAFAMAGLDDAYGSARTRVVEIVDREWSSPLRAARIEYSTVVEEGGAAATLLAVVNARDVDLLVVGRRSGHTFPGAAMGSVAHRALGFAPCPTVVVPDVG